MEMILGNAPVGFLVCDERGSITHVSAFARQLAQVDPKGTTLEGFSAWGEMFDSEGRHVPLAEWPSARALRGEITKAKACHMVRPDRSYYDLLISACPILTPVGNCGGAVTTMVDISEHRRRELVLREQAVRKERSRMAADIHDNLSQGLNAIVLQLGAAEHASNRHVSHAQRSVSLALALARQTLREARRTMWVLSHDGLENEDTATAIGFVAKRLFEGTAVKVELSLQDERHPVSPKIRRELLQIGKEAMANALKHAQAKQVWVELAFDVQAVRLSVSDNGRGFLIGPLPGMHRGYGLFSMLTRAENLGGTLAIDSHLGRGTSVSARVPLTTEPRSDKAVACL
jgi:signal transduction histidine kinase